MSSHLIKFYFYLKWNCKMWQKNFNFQPKHKFFNQYIHNQLLYLLGFKKPILKILICIDFMLDILTVCHKNLYLVPHLGHLGFYESCRFYKSEKFKSVTCTVKGSKVAEKWYWYPMWGGVNFSNDNQFSFQFQLWNLKLMTYSRRQMNYSTKLVKTVRIGMVHLIIHNKLYYHKTCFCARWFSRQLVDNHEQTRLHMCLLGTQTVPFDSRILMFFKKGLVMRLDPSFWVRLQAPKHRVGASNFFNQEKIQVPTIRQ